MREKLEGLWEKFMCAFIGMPFLVIVGWLYQRGLHWAWDIGILCGGFLVPALIAVGIKSCVKPDHWPATKRVIMVIATIPLLAVGCILWHIVVLTFQRGPDGPARQSDALPGLSGVNR